ncbi:MAG: hypothetical protein HUJ25_14540 [Crocinitomicaceae bacterium]|nr:hypothetical protein [Crocinitomicaceae bacterium]
MIATLQKINPLRAEELESFYQIAVEIRQRNCEFELPWKEARNIESFIHAHDLNYTFLIGSSEETACRLGAFYFKDDRETGFIGWYECDNDPEIAKQLLTTAINWFKEQNVKKIYGPVNGTTWDAYRFNLTSPRPLFPGEPYQPQYYPEQWQNLNFKEEIQYETNIIPRDTVKKMRRENFTQILDTLDAKLIPYPYQLPNDELRVMYEFYLKCFEKNPHFKHITFEQYKTLTDTVEPITDYNHSFLVTNKAGDPVSVLISFKDIYHDLYSAGKLSSEDNKKRTLYMKTIATIPEWRNKKISQMLVNFGCNVAYESGYEEVVFGTMFVSNLSAVKSKEIYKAQTLRKYALMSLEL